MEYVLNVLQPQFSLRLDLRAPSGVIRKVEVMASKRQTKKVTSVFERDIGALRRDRHLRRARYAEMGDSLMILRLPDFSEESNVHEMIDKARNHKALVVDLRGNPGGDESILQSLLGSVFDRDVKIADRIARKNSAPVMAKSDHHHLFTGKLIVLVDNRSASAAELFARVVQIERRGAVMGDRTSGSVMEARYYSHHTEGNPYFDPVLVYYAVMVAEAEMVMSDGNSLEHIGVIPDETILPTVADLASDRDPVMARAAKMAGVTLTPEDAAKLFPFEWPTD
jgi:C-terminal processing protease CtpA/Prc